MLHFTHFQSLIKIALAETYNICFGFMKITNIAVAIFLTTMADVLFILTVILTNIRKQCGPTRLKNMYLYIIYVPWITKPYSSRPDVAVMVPTMRCTQLCTKRQSTSTDTVTLIYITLMLQ